MMLIVEVIGEVNPGPPRFKKSPLHDVRRMMSYATKDPTNPMKPVTAATPAALLVPAPTTGGGGGASIADTVLGTTATNMNALAVATRINIFILTSNQFRNLALRTALDGG